MKRRILILTALATSLLLSAMYITAVVASQHGKTSEVLIPEQPARASGGNYRLTVPVWQASGASRGGGYTLQGPSASGVVDKCCCIYLPCVGKNP
jgi:hypothetical protein